MVWHLLKNIDMLHMVLLLFSFFFGGGVGGNLSPLNLLFTISRGLKKQMEEPDSAGLVTGWWFGFDSDLTSGEDTCNCNQPLVTPWHGWCSV